MNNLERDSKQHDVLVMEMSTQEKTVRNSGWCGGKDTSYIQNKRTNEKIWLRQENGVYVLDLMVAPPPMSNDRSTDPHFHRNGQRLRNLQARLKTQLRKVVPELCAKDVPERVAEVDMSSSNPVRSDPLPDWLQPFDENLVR